MHVGNVAGQQVLKEMESFRSAMESKLESFMSEMRAKFEVVDKRLDRIEDNIQFNRGAHWALVVGILIALFTVIFTR